MKVTIGNQGEKVNVERTSDEGRPQRFTEKLCLRFGTCWSRGGVQENGMGIMGPLPSDSYVYPF